MSVRSTLRATTGQRGASPKSRNFNILDFILGLEGLRTLLPGHGGKDDQKLCRLGLALGVVRSILWN